MADSKHEHAGDQGSGANGPASGPDEGVFADDGSATGPDGPFEAGVEGGAGTPASAPPAAGASELDALRERHLRLAAEFDNYRKRVERERGDAWVRAQAQLLERLLEPLDDLQRIADFDPETTASGALHEGAEMVERKFL
ncbi:MAG TPA: nucleotide exchange factor GrpE, partial [Longimicrobiaceae bacterium]|nr:nucleotide exchange factor GrpE [Longimicrobiaceae bacterium]